MPYIGLTTKGIINERGPRIHGAVGFLIGVQCKNVTNRTLKNKIHGK